MAQPFKILVPVEFSPRCRGAVQYAEALARHDACEIVLLHVIPPPSAYLGSTDAATFYTTAEFLDDVETERTGQLDGFSCSVPEHARVRRLVLHGDPATVIVQTAHAEHASLIMMPTHGYGPFRRFLLGSVTAKVLHDAECPVWTGPHMEQAHEPSAIGFRRVLCAVDLGIHTRQVLCWGGSFAARYASQVAVVHVIPSSETRLGPLYFDPEWRLSLVRESRERMQFVTSDMGLRAEVLVGSGEVAQAIHRAAIDWQADLVVVGRGMAAHAHTHLPSHSYAIVRESPCPVVSTCATAIAYPSAA